MKDKHNILLSEQCLVKLKISPFTNEVLCDIMPMDCCHVLLGRPLQFDKDVVYDGRMYKYSSWKDCVTLTLLPLIETPNELSCT